MFAFHANFSPYLGEGPMYPIDGFDINRCKTDWWTHVVYLNNIFPKRDVPIGVSFIGNNTLELLKIKSY